MVLNDFFLIQVARAFNKESFSTINAYSVSTSPNFVSSPTLLSITGEVLPRRSTTNSRTDNVVTFNGIRSGAHVINVTSGDYLYGVGFWSGTNGSLMFNASVPGLLHTTSFDLDFDLKINFVRSGE